MKTPLVFGALTYLCVALPCHAGLDLGWDDCISDGGVGHVALDCDGSGPQRHDLYASFQVHNRVSQFIALDFTIDVMFVGESTDDFWQFASGECNSGNLLLDDARFGDCLSANPVPCFPTGAHCTSGFAWASNVGTWQRSCSSPTGLRMRLIGSLYRDATNPVSLEAWTNYFGFKLSFFTNGAIENGGSCVGCAQNGGIIWNSAIASGLVGTGNQTEVADEPIEGPGIVGNCVSFNSGPSLCGAVPTLNTTWGQIKSHYQ